MYICHITYERNNSEPTKYMDSTITPRVSININNHIAEVVLNRPEKMNAIDIHMFDALIDAGKQVSEDPAVRVVILRGEGKAFCAGLDLSNFSMDENSVMNSIPLPDRTHGIANRWQQAVWTWHKCPVPVIASVHGVSYGGGLQVMSGADIKLIHPDTKLSIMEVKWGIIPDMAGTQLWRHNVRQDILKELTYTHKVFTAEESVQYGFTTRIEDEPLQAARTLAAKIASKSPSAIVKAKKLLNECYYLNEEEGLLLESVEQEEIIRKHNQIEAVFSAMQKRPGNFKDFR